MCEHDKIWNPRLLWVSHPLQPNLNQNWNQGMQILNIDLYSQRGTLQKVILSRKFTTMTHVGGAFNKECH